MKKDKDIKMISLDSATGKTGVCIWQNGKYAESYVIENNPKIKGDEKLNSMIDLIYSLLKVEEPEVIILEQVAVTRNAVSTRMLQELTGAIRGFCVERGVKYVTLRPSEWRKQIVEIYNQKPSGRKRDDQKIWSLDIVNNKLNIETESDDEADAICIGKAYIEIQKKGEI